MVMIGCLVMIWKNRSLLLSTYIDGEYVTLIVFITFFRLRNGTCSGSIILAQQALTSLLSDDNSSRFKFSHFHKLDWSYSRLF